MVLSRCLVSHGDPAQGVAAVFERVVHQVAQRPEQSCFMAENPGRYDVGLKPAHPLVFEPGGKFQTDGFPQLLELQGLEIPLAILRGEVDVDVGREQGYLFGIPHDQLAEPLPLFVQDIPVPFPEQPGHPACRNSRALEVMGDGIGEPLYFPGIADQFLFSFPVQEDPPHSVQQEAQLLKIKIVIGSGLVADRQ